MQPVDGVHQRFYEQFGSRVRQARRLAGIKQEELGRRVGLNRSSISNVEIGRQRVPLHMLVVFAEALQVSAETLLPTEQTQQTDPLRDVPADSRRFVEDILSTASETTRG
jgi:transcriptional regulator with XRE-family HTH domain